MPKKCSLRSPTPSAYGWVYRNGRANVEVTFRAPDGQKVIKRLMADTGASLEFILSKENLALLKFIDAPDADGGVWGKRQGALVYLSMPELSQVSHVSCEVKCRPAAWIQKLYHHVAFAK